jgi:3-isopropylmalate dehydratase small subunit
METTDPKPLLDEINLERLSEIINQKVDESAALGYVEPGQENDRPGAASAPKEISLPILIQAHPKASDSRPPEEPIKGKVQVLGDFIDTDALAPSEALVTALSQEELGTWCLKYTHPDFRQRVKNGQNIVVAGKAFGVGSSRENAVTALQGAGVQAVIARAFAFIYGRNQPNLGMLGFIIDKDGFYEAAVDGADIEIDVPKRIVRVGGEEFVFQLSELERQLWHAGGMSPAFRRWGKGLLEVMTSGDKKSNTVGAAGGIERSEEQGHHAELKW